MNFCTQFRPIYFFDFVSEFYRFLFYSNYVGPTDEKTIRNRQFWCQGPEIGSGIYRVSLIRDASLNKGCWVKEHFRIRETIFVSGM